MRSASGSGSRCGAARPTRRRSSWARWSARGLAQALLVDAFALGREHGAKRSALSTDSRTGALTLYQKVGMEVGDVWVNRASEV